MNFENIKLEVQDGIARLTLNRPDRLNSFNDAMHAELRVALDAIQNREGDAAGARVLVLTGAGRGFCAGADLAEFDFAPGPDLVRRADPGPIIEQAFNPTTRRLMALKVPTVAAINGVAAGAGV